ncbi:uncharacterized protein LOC106876918 [Octopus bimaculoides]|uniref:uncharacterized protein LOC106876918 n=1 Tax=Octopus bimaculoides TaxID=37653 RepID=UPI0022DF1352|nr:uncharacterized protein LOC106876918 [Octopus bimaculoides]
MPPNLEREPKGRRQELHYGMYSLRSFILPKLLIIITRIIHLLGASNIHPFLIWKTIHATITSFLPWSVYKFSREAYKSHDLAVIACILAAFSVHLSVFGTHTLISTFLSPFVFLSLSVIWRTLCSDLPCFYTKNTIKVNRNGTVDIRENRNISWNNDVLKRISKKTDAEKIYRDKNNTGNNNTIIGVIGKHLRNFGTGIMIGILLYIRIDLLVFYTAIFCPVLSWYISKWRLFFQQFIIITFGVLLGIAIGAIDDYYTYGKFFISPKQWFLFNVFSDHSNMFFGQFGISFYFINIVLHNAAVILMLVLTFLTILVIKVRKFKISNPFVYHCTYTSLFLSSSAIIVLFTFSLKGHKEMRFLHNFVVLVLIVYASTLKTILHCIYSKVISKTTKTTKTTLNSSLVFLLLVYVKHQWNLFPSGKSTADWSYSDNFESGNINQCLYYVHLEDDVTGVFLDESLYFSGAYSLLHRDVPFLPLIHMEFYEFSKESRIPIKYQFEWLKVDNTNKPTTHVSALSNISDYLSVYNTPYLIKKLMKNNVYNYLIVKKFQKFIDLGFKLVFQSGMIKVLKKVSNTTLKKNFKYFLNPFSSISENNLTLNDIFLHEGHFLYSLGQYEKAEQRLLAALQYAPIRVATYQLLFNIYQHFGKFNESNRYWNVCAKLFGEEECRKPVEIVDLQKLPSNR